MKPDGPGPQPHLHAHANIHEHDSCRVITHWEDVVELSSGSVWKSVWVFLFCGESVMSLFQDFHWKIKIYSLTGRRLYEMTIH